MNPEHQQAQEISIRADLCLRELKTAEARKLFAEAAKLEREALAKVPPDKTRTRGILAVSLAALLFKASDYEGAEREISSFLSREEKIPVAARRQLEEILREIRSKRCEASSVGGFRSENFGLDGFIPRSQPIVRPTFLVANVLVLLLALASLIFQRKEVFTPAPALPIAKVELAKVNNITTAESFNELCQDLGTSEEKFKVCRKKLYLLEDTSLMIDSDFLVEKGETLNTEHVGAFYGLAGSENEAARLAMSAILAARCRHGELAEALPFEVLVDDPRCLERLPTLAQVGLEIDRTWIAADSREADLQ